MNWNERTIVLVAGLHGNERAPVRALAASGRPFVHGNPSAYEKNVRFVDADLNASFGVLGGTSEASRAEQLLTEIDESDLVVDFHTTASRGPTFAILTDIAMLPLARKTGLTHAVLMTHNIKKGHALINYRDGVSVEMSGHDTEESFETTLRVVECLEYGARGVMEVYEVYGVITEPGEYENFVLHAGGFYPVLVGEEAYNFIGLKARKFGDDAKE
jgi:predicted deacylase